MSATYVGFYKGTQNLLEGANCGTDTWKLALTNAAPTIASDTTIVSELAAGNGYIPGGVTLAVASHTLVGAAYQLTLTIPSPTWTSNTGNMGPFRYVILYNATVSQCVAYWDYGVGGVTLNGLNGDTFTATVASYVIQVVTP